MSKISKNNEPKNNQKLNTVKKIVKETNVFVFTFGEFQKIQKPVKSFISFIKFLFLSIQIFNIIYLIAVFIFFIKHRKNYDVQQVLSNILGLILIGIFFLIRIYKNFYGIYAVLLAKSRRPLYLFLLISYFVTIIYILFGIFVLFTNYLKNNFYTSMTHHLSHLTNHFSYEKPTWYWVENTQYFGDCCGYVSFWDYTDIYRKKFYFEEKFSTQMTLPRSCCKDLNYNEIEYCNMFRKDLKLDGCSNRIRYDIFSNIIFPLYVLVVLDVLSLIFVVYFMRNFKSNLYRIELKEEKDVFLKREENRLIDLLLTNKFITNNEIGLVKAKLKELIKIEETLNRRATIEGLIIVIKFENGLIETRVVDPGLLKSENNKNYNYMENLRKTGFKDLFKDQNQTQDKKEKDQILPNKIKDENTLLMVGGEKLNKKDAENNLLEFGLNKKIIPSQAVRSRNAIMLILKKQEQLNNMKKLGLRPKLFKFNSLNLRLDKHTIEKELRELKRKGEKLPEEIKSKVFSDKLDKNEEKQLEIRIKRKKMKRKPIVSILKNGLMKNKVSTTSDIIDDKAFNSDEEWTDIK